MVVLDSTVLLLLLDPNAKPPLDPGTGKPLDRCRERVECLVSNFEKTKTIALIPTPVLCEVLVRAPNRNEIVDRLHKASVFEVGDFDAVAAIETADLIKAGLSIGGPALEGKARAKFDAQILGIAKAKRVTAIYTDDARLARQAVANGITAIATSDIPLPPQQSLL